MRTTTRWFAVAAVAAGLAACGESGGGGGAAGAWTFDVEATMGPMLEKAKAEQMKKMEGMSAEQKKMMESVLGGRDMADAMKEQFKSRSITIHLNADGSASMDMSGPGNQEKGTGTWSESGGKVVITPKTSNGKPVEGDAAKPTELSWRGGTLVGHPPGTDMEIVLKRK